MSTGERNRSYVSFYAQVRPAAYGVRRRTDVNCTPPPAIKAGKDRRSGAAATTHSVNVNGKQLFRCCERPPPNQPYKRTVALTKATVANRAD